MNVLLSTELNQVKSAGNGFRRLWFVCDLLLALIDDKLLFYKTNITLLCCNHFHLSYVS